MTTESAGTRFRDVYRKHFDATYGDRDFEAMAPAYDFGRRAASDSGAGDPFARAERALRAGFSLRYPEMKYAEAREAVRFGYEAAQRLKPGADTATTQDAAAALDEWARTLFPGDHDASTNATSRNMAQRRAQ